MKSARIADRIREPKQTVDHRPVCMTKTWFPSRDKASLGWLGGVYQCPVCGGWHHTSKRKEADMYGENGNG